MMQRVLFGDNQFFGVNHMSEEKARAQAIRFQDIGSVISVLDAAYDEGINVFMCTTHERIAEICDHMRNNPKRYAEFEFYPCMPYAHKYANSVTELGILGALNKAMPDGEVFTGLLKGGVSLARKDIEGLARILIDTEMRMFKGLKTPVIFLQNVVTDLLLGLGMKDALRMFADHIRIKYEAEPGFITMNLPRALDALDAAGVENPIICTNINKIGFRMSGGLEAYRAAIANRKFRAVAMSVFASGALQPREALEYVCGHRKIESIVFGASSRSNIRQTKQLIDELTT